MSLGWLAAGLLVAPALVASARGASEQATDGPTIGMPARLELIAPGPELEAVPRDDRAIPIVLRIVRVVPHGSMRRYELEYSGFDPGTYDLRDYLRRKDGSTAADLEPIPVTIRPVLPPGQVEPNELVRRPTPRPWGYRAAILVGSVAWLVGLATLLLGGRRRRAVASVAVAQPKTLAERLRPLVQDAVSGGLDPAGRAELERLLIGFWRRKVGLEDLEPARAVAILRDHDEAGPVLRRLEDWLHRPPGALPEGVDIAQLLEPYRDLPADALEPRVASASAGRGA